MMTSAKHEGYFLVECVELEQGFQTLFITREERFKRYKNQRDDFQDASHLIVIIVKFSHNKC